MTSQVRIFDGSHLTPVIALNLALSSIAGPFSPLSFTQAPLFVTTFRPQEWVRRNEGWISASARDNGVRLGEVTLAALKNMMNGARR